MSDKLGMKEVFVTVRLDERGKRRLRALALLRGQTQSDVLRDLIDRAPIEEKHNGAQVSEAGRAVAAG